MAFKLIAVFLALVAAASAAPESRIVGGTPTDIVDFPYIAAFVYTYPGPGITIQRCVGSIVSSWHVVTSGFCFTGAVLDNMKVRAGSTSSLTGGELRGISEFIKHPSYNEDPRTGDIAVAVLDNPLFMSESINVLYIPPQGTYIADGTSVKVVSWGFESEQGPQIEVLKTINLNKIPLAQCQEQFSDVSEVSIDDPVICAGDQEGKGMCLGDSGAPMVIGQVVVGVSSYFKNCGDESYPDVFTRIDRYTDWIIEVATTPNTRISGPGIKTVTIQY